jgi:hypothetical protein
VIAEGRMPHSRKKQKQVDSIFHQMGGGQKTARAAEAAGYA